MPTTWRSGNSSARMIQRDAVVRVVERRNDHDAVGDVEIRVARREPLAVHHHRPRIGELHDAQSPPAPASSSRRRLSTSDDDSRRRPDPPRRRARSRRARRSARCRRRGRACRRRRSPSPSQIVWRMPRCSRNARSYPSRSRPGLRTCTSESRHSSVTSSVPSPSVSMPPPSSTTRSPLLGRTGSTRGSPVMRAMAAPTFVVAREVSILRPRVEAPVHRAPRDRRSSMHAGRRGVAQPDAVGRDDVQADILPRRRAPRACSCAEAARFRHDRGSRRARARAARARSRRTPTEWARACRANRARDAARRSRWRRAGPTRPGKPARRNRDDDALKRRDISTGSARTRRCAGRAGTASCAACPR